MTMPTTSRKTSLTRPETSAGERIVLRGIRWDSYKTICAAVDNRHVRMTYAAGDLDIMVISSEHDNLGNLFGLIVFTLARFYGKKVKNCGSFTHQREDIERGFEPDQCFYLAHVDAVRGKKKLDLATDPPPDLMIEIDVSRSSLDRMSIFAAFGVPEVWRYDTKRIQVHVLSSGEYASVGASPTFPQVPIPELEKFLDIGLREDDVAMVDALEVWLTSLPAGESRGGRKRKRK